MNSITLVGRICKTPTLKYGDKDVPFCFFRIAIKRVWKSFKPEAPTTDFFNVVCYEHLAEAAAQFTGKGSRIVVQGRLENRKFMMNGKWAWTNQIVAERLEFFGPGKEDKPPDDGMDESEENLGDMPF